MEINSLLSSHLCDHYKKLIFLCTATATIYMIKKYMDKRQNKSNSKKMEKKKLKDFPTVDEIQRFIEDLPFEEMTNDKPLSLKDLLGELSEFSDNEDWKELIASVHTMYEEKPANLEDFDETGSVESIYEDPEIVTITGMTPRDEQMPSIGDIKKIKNKGHGDAVIDFNLAKAKKKERQNLEMGEGDKKY
ncbi:unnamed protein product [Ceutorhynchus assimilis]|uniref:Uncharacterized protein n=1 Tax=Ceutorhynchus assimilis TaxID=467358 RepID=A0A9N9MSL5_9CUCU|nr:unnamed protein product [Ceutorhynchus assimilis]